MEKEQARKIVQNTFENPFDINRFTLFIENLLNKIEKSRFNYNITRIPDAFKKYVTKYERIGKYNDGSNRIDILAVYLSNNTSMERARTMQRNFVAGYLNGKYGSDKLKDAALVAFISSNNEDWRFSLVKMDHQIKDGKVSEEFTSARRWSFLVGKNENSHTAQSQLVPIMANDEHNPTLAELEGAFNIEKVTKEFFGKYRDLFLSANEMLDEAVSKNKEIKDDFESKGVSAVDFSKKLLGQIVFLYFLQKKGWFGVERDADWGTGPKNFLRELFEKKHSQYNNFFNDILEPLFYEALARERQDDFYSRFNCKIPFLNGGLFDPLNNYDWVHTDIFLPDDLFSNKRKDIKTGDIGNGILDVFDRYNFTVREDEPLEKEVAVDPEMLGKVFENLLEVKDRKSKGTYYTPREIVHYMCQQSLINYLHTEASFIVKEDIEELIKYGETVGENEAAVEAKGKETGTYRYKLPESIRQNAQLIDGKLSNIKVCDPAIGSGAFPVGMMSEIVKIRNVLSSFIKDPNRTIYNFKRECIEKSLYGVDIDPGAVEIAKLRLWLSLVVDEDDFKEIKPLPNLDYKIVCGNSLLGVEKNLLNDDLFTELERLKPILFSETSPKKKQEYKKQIDELISQITDGHKEFDFEIYFSEVFHEKGGFDVVIGNPPYKGFRDLDNKIKKIVLERFQTISGKFDLYLPFIEKSFHIMKGKGFFTFICPTAFTKREHGNNLRNFLIKNTNIIELVDFEHSQMFENATNYTGVFSFIKNSPSTNNKILYKQGLYSNAIKIEQSKFLGSLWVFVDVSVQTIIDKIKNNIESLEKFAIVSEGVVTGLNELYLKSTEEITKNKFENNYFYQCYRGKDIKKYHLKKFSEKLFYPYNLVQNKTVVLEESIFQKNCPCYYNYLKENLDVINKREYFLKSQKLWFELWNQRKWNHFNKEKIVTPELSEHNSFMIAPANMFYGDTVCGIIIKNEFIDKLHLKYILALLNSKLIEWFYKKTTVPKAGGFFIYKVMYLDKIPIKLISSNDQQLFINLVDEIFAINNDAGYFQNSTKQVKVKECELQIDQMVYELYGLTEKEIKIVEDLSQK